MSKMLLKKSEGLVRPELQAGFIHIARVIFCGCVCISVAQSHFTDEHRHEFGVIIVQTGSATVD